MNAEASDLELTELRSRLAKAEEDLHAIRNGDVDARLMPREERLARLILEQAAAAVIVCDEQGRVVRASQPAQRIFTSNLQGGGFAELLPLQTDDAEPFQLAPVLNGKTIRDLDVTLDFRGQKFDLILNAGALRNGPQIVGCVITLTDITERKRVEARLVELAAIIESSDDCIIGKDLNGCVTSWNHGAEMMLGYSASEMIGHSITRIIPENLREEEKHILDTIRRGGSIGHFETVRQTKESRLVDVAVTASPIKDGTGTIVGVSKVVRDISNRKKAEKVLEQAVQDLREKNTELEQFLYTASHDLKSPIVTIRTFLGYVELDLAAADSERLAKDIQFIRAATEKMTELLDDLLMISRIGHPIGEPVNVTFHQLVEDALCAVAGQMAERGVTTEVTGPDVPLFGDRRWLWQIWQNLLDNACKFMGDQPTPRIEFGVQDRNGVPIFWVRDNGIGIDPRYHDKIFNLFDRLNPKIEGTGIGLALVRRIVEFYGGKIWVESTGDGQGACFYFNLPAATMKPPQGEPT